MKYQIAILPRAVKELAALQEHDRLRIQTTISALGGNPHPYGVKKLAGRGGYRIRSGHYRVIFEIDNSAGVITVLHVGHRKDVYG